MKQSELSNKDGIKHRVDTSDKVVWYCDRLKLSYKVFERNHVRVTDFNNTLDIFKKKYHWLEKNERGWVMSIPKVLQYVFGVKHD